MRKVAFCISLLFFVPPFLTVSHAQEPSRASKSATRSDATPAPAHYYSIHYVLEELDSAGKPVNSRSFTTMVSNGGRRPSTFVVGSRFPIITSTPKNGATEIQYIDVGIKMTATDIHEDGSDLAFDLSVENSSTAAPVTLAGVPEPVLRQNVWNGDVLLPIGKPTIVFKSDSLDSKGSMQLLVTATKID